MKVKEKESGTLIELLNMHKEQNFLDTAYKFLRKEFDLIDCYQSCISREKNFAKRLEIPIEIFSSALILSTLKDSKLEPEIKKHIVLFLQKHHQQGLFSYFTDKSILPNDTDDTSLALSVLIEHNAISLDVAHAAASKVFENVTEEGIVHVYLPPRKQREDYFRVDAVVCANVVYLAYLLKRQEEVLPTIDYLLNFVKSHSYLQSDKFIYYKSPQAFLYFLSNSLRFKQFSHIFQQYLKEGISITQKKGYSPLDLAFEIIFCQRLGIECHYAKQQLKAMQKKDGSWKICPIYKFGRSNVFFGSSAIVTAFAIRALDDN